MFVEVVDTARHVTEMCVQPRVACIHSQVVYEIEFSVDQSKRIEHGQRAQVVAVGLVTPHPRFHDDERQAVAADSDHNNERGNDLFHPPPPFGGHFRPGIHRPCENKNKKRF